MWGLRRCVWDVKRAGHSMSVKTGAGLLTGDLMEQGGSTSFDFYVDKAVKRYQASNGLAPTGIVDKRTIASLNIPAASRLKQLKANLARLTELSRTAGKRYVLVNIPAAQIEAGRGN